MGILFALGAALAYGVSDFLGGYLARRQDAVAVAFASQVIATGAVLGLTVLYEASGGLTVGLTPTAALWGAASGLGTGVGLAFLYRGLGGTQMSRVSAISAVASATLPVLIAVIVLNERPSVLAALGILLGVPASVIIIREEAESTREVIDGSPPRPLRGGDSPVTTTPSSSARRGLLDGLLSGAGFALGFVALGQIPAAAGLRPLLLAEVVSVLTVVGLAALTRASLRIARRDIAPVSLVGIVAAAALTLYWYSTHSRMLSVVVVLASLYPAVTVLLARTVLKERIGRIQMVGLGLAAVAVVLLATG